MGGNGTSSKICRFIVGILDSKMDRQNRFQNLERKELIDDTNRIKKQQSTAEEDRTCTRNWNQCE